MMLPKSSPYLVLFFKLQLNQSPHIDDSVLAWTTTMLKTYFLRRLIIIIISSVSTLYEQWSGSEKERRPQFISIKENAAKEFSVQERS